METKIKYNTKDMDNAYNWISVNDRLPNDGDEVLIYTGYKYDIVSFNKGISLNEREKDSSHRSKLIKPEDEYGNNKRPYNWTNSPVQYFGQEITHWMPLPESPK